MTKACLLLGTNIGCRMDHLKKAVEELGLLAGDLYASSSVYETAAWGKIEQDDYLNQVIVVNTSQSPDALLEITSGIETRMGRIRKKVWEPRIIDIDILFYGNMQYVHEKLIIPHPHIQERRFALTPLVEILPNFVHPVFQKTIKELLTICTDPLRVEKYAAVNVG